MNEGMKHKNSFRKIAKCAMTSTIMIIPVNTENFKKRKKYKNILTKRHRKLAIITQIF